MSVRKDKYQLSIEFVTDESKAFAKTLTDTKQFQRNIQEAEYALRKYESQLKDATLTEAKRAEILAKVAEQEKIIAANTKAVADAAKGTANIDLSKLVSAQLVQRADQLKLAMRTIPASSPQYAELRDELKRVNDRMATLNKETRGVAAAMDDLKPKNGGLLQTILGVAGGVGLVDILSSIGQKLKDLVVQSLEFYNVGAKADAQLNAVLKSTNQIAGRNIEQLNAQADALQKLTLFDDEATKGSQALLLTFTKVRDEVFDASIPLIQDYATAMATATGESVDLKSATIQVGKALNDPLRGLVALGKAGVQFSAQQKEQIKDFVETGRVADAQRIILAELETQFGGSAQAAAEAGLGGLTIFQNRIDNIKESVGELLAEKLEKMKPTIDTAIGAVEDFVEAEKKSEVASTGWGKALQFVYEGYKALLGVSDLAEKAGAKVRNFFTGEQDVQARSDEQQAVLKQLAEEQAAAKAKALADKLRAEEVAEARKKADEEAQKKREESFKKAEAFLNESLERERLLLENQHINRVIDEQAYQEQLYQNEKQALERRLALYTLYGQSQTAKAQEVTNKLDEIRVYEADRAKAALDGEIARLEELGVAKLDLQNVQAESEKRIKESVQAYTQELADAEVLKYKEKTEAQAKAQEELKQKLEVISLETFQSLAELSIDFFSKQKKNSKEFLKEFLQIMLSAVQKQILVSIAAATAKEAESKPFPANLITTGLKIAAINAAFALAKSAVKGFATGGQVISGRRVTEGSNIATRANGDNVLATLRTGEVVLNEGQQAMLGGPAVFRRIGVPGFALGGVVNTTPDASVAAAVQGTPFSSNTQALERKLDMVNSQLATVAAALRAMPTNLKANVVYTELEAKAETLGQIRDEANA